MIAIDDAAGVRTLTLDRPETLNALTYAMLDALIDALAVAAADRSVGCVVVTGAGRGFCSGADIRENRRAYAADDALPAEVRRFPRSFEEEVAQVERWSRGLRLLRDMPKPSIAMINGPCAGAGMSIAGACDLRFAAASAVFTTAYAAIGASGDLGGSWYWTQIVGSARARELYLLSDRIDARTARAWGMVSEVSADADLAAHVRSIASRLAGRSAVANRHIKANINAAESEPIDAVSHRESTGMMLCARRWMDDGRR